EPAYRAKSREAIVAAVKVAGLRQIQRRVKIGARLRVIPAARIDQPFRRKLLLPLQLERAGVDTPAVAAEASRQVQRGVDAGNVGNVLRGDRRLLSMPGSSVGEEA